MAGDQESLQKQLEEALEGQRRAHQEKLLEEERAKKLEEELKKTREKSDEELRKVREELDTNKAELRKLAPTQSDCMAEGSITLEVEVEKLRVKDIVYSPYTPIGGLPFRIGCEIMNSSMCRLHLFCNDDSSVKVDSAKVTGTVILESDTSPWCSTFPSISLPSTLSAYAPTVTYESFLKNGRFTIQVHIMVIYCYKDTIIDFASPDPNFTDVALIVEGKKFNANKMYLAHHAGYFKIAFCSDFAEKAKKEIELKDINAGEFEEMLRVIYPERKKVTADTVTGLLRMADFFDVHVLIRECTDFLLSTAELSLTEKLKLTQEFRLPELQDRLVEGSKIDELKKVINENSFPLLSETLQKSLFQKFVKLSR